MVSETTVTEVSAPRRWRVEVDRRADLVFSLRGYITQDQLVGALAAAKERGELLGVTLLREQVIYEEELARTLSEQLSIPYISIGRVGVDASVTRLLPTEVGAAAAAIPVRALDSAIQVAFADPT